MDVLVFWRHWQNRIDRYDDVDAITCDGHTVRLVQQEDTFKFPLSAVKEFQILEDDL
jgi:hypothetical protein